MLIYVVMIIFILILLLTGAYMLWSERHGQFLIFNFSNDSKLSTLFTVTSVALFVVSFLGIFILFTLSKNYNFITLILGTLIILFFSVSFNRYNK